MVELNPEIGRARRSPEMICYKNYCILLTPYPSITSVLDWQNDIKNNFRKRDFE